MKTTDYIGNFNYENGELSFILMPEGRIVLNNEQQKSDTDSIYKAEPKVATNSFEYQYFIKDHLGDTRLVISQAGEVLENNSYYPFGMLIESLSQSAAEPENAYKYNGKELADDYGLDWYEYGARFYDPLIGRWHVIDPLAEKYYNYSPYDYCVNNPIKFIDINGFATGWVITEGMVVWDDNVKSQESAEKNYGESAVYGGENTLYVEQKYNGNSVINKYEKTEGGSSVSNEPDMSVTPDNCFQIDLGEVKVTGQKTEKNQSAEVVEKPDNGLERFAKSADDWANKVGPKVANYVLSLNPIYSVPNAVKSAFVGEDLMGNKKSGFYQRRLSPAIDVFSSLAPLKLTTLETIYYGTGKYILDNIQSSIKEKQK